MEKALLRHIQDVLEDKFIENMVDEDINLISDDNTTVLDYLTETLAQNK